MDYDDFDDLPLDFACWHDEVELCNKCLARILWMRARARDQRNLINEWRISESAMAKLRLIQHETLKRTIEQAHKIVLGPPMSPFPDCDLCSEPGGLVTPEGMAFCGPCWRAHVEMKTMKEGLRWNSRR